jgi:hypothetical protein
MNRRLAAALGVGLFALAAPAVGLAHFALVAPQSALNEDQLGNPQKAAPCGGTTADKGTPSGVVTPVTGGSLLHVKVRETVYHPGHFRIALSVMDRAELPADPEDVTKDGPKGPISVSAKIDPNPKAPVLVDGLWDHHEKHPLQEFETDVKLPNINCDHCSLQVIQFMEEHGVNADGRFTYHHCADLKITANALMPIDTGWPGQAKAAAKGKAPPKAKAKS